MLPSNRCLFVAILILLGAASPVMDRAYAQGSGRDFRAKNLAGNSFAGRNLEGADFSGANLRGADFRGANLRGSNLSGADLRGATLAGVDLTGANLQRAKLPANAEGANFSGANLEGADMEKGNTSKANFSGANLRGTTGWGDVTGSVFTGAALDGADLSTAWVRPGAVNPVTAAAPARRERAEARAPEQPARPPVRGTDTAQAPAAEPRPASGARAVGTGRDGRNGNYAKQKLDYGDFRDWNLQGADFTAANLLGADFQYADLRNAKLSRANFRGANLTGADMRGAELTLAQFIGANFAFANFEDQILHLAGSIAFVPSREKLGFEATNPNLTDRGNGDLRLRGANLRNTRIYGNLQGVDLRGADLRGADLSQAENVDGAPLRNAIYDSRTRWNVDPARVGATQGEDIAPSIGVFVGSWTLRDASGEVEILDITPHAFEWISNRPAKRGTWKAAAGKDGLSIQLSGAEDRAVWILTFAPDGDVDGVRLVDSRGANARRGLRAKQP